MLASGRGSNLQAILDAIDAGELDAEVAGVFSDRPRSRALRRVPEALRWSADATAFPFRDAFDAALGDAVAGVDPDWIVCAGYMRILDASFVQRFRGRMVNIHPSLLPRHRGLRTHAHVLASGDVEHGASVHFVIPELDAGAVIAQVAIDVTASDTAEALAARLLPLEHRLLVATLNALVAGRIDERNGIAHCDGHALFTPLRLDSAGRLS